MAVPAFFHLNFIQSALGVPPSRSGAVSFSAVATDSRKIKPGSLFVALKGERVDGHDYLDAAIQSGATGLIVQKGRSIKIPGTISNSVTVFEVPDTLAAFRTLAAAWRKDFPGPVIAVAGAVGKTSTKEMLAAIVAGRKGPQTVLKTEASQNGFIGIPMTLLELRPEHKIAVIEIGIDDIGAMRSHLDIVKPTAAIVTAIGPEHFEKLKDLDTVTREETLSLTDTLDRGGSAAINLDDPEIRKKMGRTTNTRALAYSMEGRRDLPHVIWGKMEGAKLVVDSLTLDVPLPGRHQAQNLLGAIAVARILGLEDDEIRNGLRFFKPPVGRSEIRVLQSGVNCIADYYNANPASVRAALSLLAERAKTGRRWICLGDMLELGTEEEALHRALAADFPHGGDVFLFGDRMKWLLAELKKSGVPATHFATHAEMAAALKPQLRPGDWLLVKGSRGMRMEKVLQALGETLD